MVSMALNAHGGAGRLDGESETFVVGFHGAQITSKENRSQPSDIAPTLNEDPRLMIAHTLSADGFDASEDGTGRGSPLVVSAFLPGQGSKGRGIGYADEQSPTLRSGDGSAKNIGISFRTAGDGNVYESGEQTAPLTTGTDRAANVTQPGHGQAVRRLTPMEWERLMGFPDRYTLIPYPRTKDAKDGPRYKAIGNSISVPTLRWIGQRIQTVEDVLAELILARPLVPGKI